MSTCMFLAGNIVVNGVAASSYTTALGSEATMHTFTTVGRVRCNAFASASGITGLVLVIRDRLVHVSLVFKDRLLERMGWTLINSGPAYICANLLTQMPSCFFVAHSREKKAFGCLPAGATPHSLGMFVCRSCGGGPHGCCGRCTDAGWRSRFHLRLASLRKR